jgi:hypothetical protein
MAAGSSRRLRHPQFQTHCHRGGRDRSLHGLCHLETLNRDPRDLDPQRQYRARPSPQIGRGAGARTTSGVDAAARPSRRTGSISSSRQPALSARARDRATPASDCRLLRRRTGIIGPNMSRAEIQISATSESWFQVTQRLRVRSDSLWQSLQARINHCARNGSRRPPMCRIDLLSAPPRCEQPTLPSGLFARKKRDG